MLEEIAAKVKAAAVRQLNEEARVVAELAAAKAPGEKLGPAIYVDEAAQDGSLWTARVVSPDPYHRSEDPKAADPSRYNVPAFQEFGTRHNAAHPYMRPALEERRVAIVENVASAARGAARKARVRSSKKVIRMKLRAEG